MSTFYDTVIRIISKPSEERGSEEINLILAWFLNLFKRKSAVFGDIKPDVIKDIIKNCSFETKNPDDIIIKQGDVGDCFYINLRGKVSIYINHQKHDVQDAVENESVPTSNNSDELNERSLNGFDDSLTSSSWTSASNPSSSKSKKLRERLGNYVTSLGPGEGFGEIALVRDELRTASIIADEKTDLMVVNKTLYSRCLQATALRKLNEKQEFINKSPFFGNWQPKMKKLLSLCLERDIIPYDTYLGKQGEPADRMYFIISGQAKLIVNPSAHKNQYPRFYPLKLPENESQDYVNSLIESKHSPRYNVHTNNSITNAVLKRRNETFAEAEQRRKNRQIELGILGPGEISGMCELVFDMPTYMQSTRCLESCDVFYIFRRSYERLIAKRNPNCIGKMKSNVLVKLSARNARLPIDLFRSIEYTIRLQMRSTTTTTPSSSNNIVAKSSTSTVSGIVGANNTGSSSMSSASSMSSPRVITAHQGSNILPQRGALVQLDSHTYMQSKSKLLNRARQQHLREKQKKHEEKLEQQKKIMRLYRSGVDLEEDEDDNDSEQKEPNSNENNGVRTTYHPIMIGPNNNIVIMNAGVDLKSLEELEDKMKKWQLDLGCKKAFVTKMNRVELSVDASKKSIVKTRAMTMPSAATSTTTGQTWAQPIRGSAARSQHDSNVKNRRERQLPAASRNKTNSMLLSRSSSSSSMSIDMDNSSDASTTVNSSSGDSNETGATRSTLALRRRGYNYVRGHEAPPASSLDFNANKLLSFARFKQTVDGNTRKRNIQRLKMSQRGK